MNKVSENLTLQKLHPSVPKTRFHHEPQLIWMMQGILLNFLL